MQCEVLGMTASTSHRLIFINLFSAEQECTFHTVCLKYIQIESLKHLYCCILCKMFSIVWLMFYPCLKGYNRGTGGDLDDSMIYDGFPVPGKANGNPK